jgi:hypothetical protein
MPVLYCQLFLHLSLSHFSGFAMVQTHHLLHNRNAATDFSFNILLLRSTFLGAMLEPVQAQPAKMLS